MQRQSDAAVAFSCSPLRSGQPGAAVHPLGVTIDIHCHIHVDAADQLVAPFRRSGQEPILDHASAATMAQNRASLAAVKGKLCALEARLADMDAHGIDMQIISPSPFQYFYWADADLGRQSSQCVNNWIAEAVARHGDRFKGICTVPMQNTELAVEELQRAVIELGLCGVEIGTHIRSEELSCERLRPFFAKAQELDTFVFIHPNGFSEGGRLASHNLINLIGNPLETTIAASHLIFGGTIRAMPGLKICLAHGGGYLPMYHGRMDHAYSVRPDCRSCIDEIPSNYLRQFYFDSVVYQTSQLEFLVKTYGADRILMGTDYPYDMGEPDAVGLVAKCDSLNEEEKAAVLGGNAARLLGLDPDLLKRLVDARGARRI
jgi:aminocarboxymuconate-semialdehyde decarboxylase